jgi:methylated-DNA-[protein]-cysteine S-methyltransferase
MNTTRKPQRYDLVMASPLGRLGVQCRDGSVVRLDYLDDSVLLQPATARLAKQVARALEDYLLNGRARFTLPVGLQGTPFQRRVWQALTRIPAGQTRTYGELARTLESGARAVGNACRNNPLPIIVPCHRVVGANGIGGYSGKTSGMLLARKRWLLEHEMALPALKSA